MFVDKSSFDRRLPQAFKTVRDWTDTKDDGEKVTNVGSTDDLHFPITSAVVKVEQWRSNCSHNGKSAGLRYGPCTA